jgi:hypothetical protein
MAFLMLETAELLDKERFRAWLKQGQRDAFLAFSLISTTAPQIFDTIIAHSSVPIPTQSSRFKSISSKKLRTT